ncbi:hypothetical protein EV697_101416 [Bisgaardia hudsonensis]|uniref:Uncharacterized protein n=1 Tax=Bisgaardia hudsonensis TaxID=109472 RepID=A0A4R2N359_9PAST|nr:hypothetical protein [Bisgaardia hudsonensis]QLB12726.1 hypothetical protein A6A11_03455 [Bisgaardia hudsonensis]TCP14277.1 hypothetical protein EV697_101416 [Bisgaardia hudsonensis]
MGNISFSYIYIDKEPVNLSSELKLSNKNIVFLHSALKQSTAIHHSDNFSKIKATFFHGSRFEKTLCCEQCLTDICQSKKELNDKLTKQKDVASQNIMSKVTVVENVGDKIDNIDDIIFKNSSWFIRGSESLKREKFLACSNEFRCIDGRGMALLTKYSNKNKEQSSRGIFLVMLALAYYLALQQISEELSLMLNDTKNIEKLDKLYTEAATFNARYYFHNPIAFSRYSTFEFWNDIREVYQLEQKNNEVISQLSQVHQILSDAQQKLEQKKAEKRNYCITILGLFLSLLGVIEVIDIILDWIHLK